MCILLSHVVGGNRHIKIVFFPFSGNVDDGSNVNNVGNNGNFYSVGYNGNNANYLSVDSNGNVNLNNNERYYGYPVRAVQHLLFETAVISFVWLTH